MMNPTFFAMHKAVMKSMLNLMMGIPHEPKKRKPIEDGPAFASKRNYDGADIDEYPRSDMVKEMEEERNVYEP